MNPKTLLPLAMAFALGCGQAAGPGGTGGGLLSSGPSAEKEGTEWNLKELAAYLQKSGLKGEYNTKGGDLVIGIGKDGEKSFQSTMEIASRSVIPQGPGVAVISQANNPQQARDIAGKWDDASWHWGRFVFIAENETPLTEIKNHLSR